MDASGWLLYRQPRSQAALARSRSQQTSVSCAPYRGFEIVKNAELLFSATKAGKPVSGCEGVKEYGVETSSSSLMLCLCVAIQPSRRWSIQLSGGSQQLSRCALQNLA